MSTDRKQADVLQTIPMPRNGLRVGRFLMHFFELQISMGIGALICYLVVRLISSSPTYAMGYRPGTFLFAIGDLFFLTVPVVAWMIFRGHGGRHSLEIAGAMIVPVGLIAVLGELARYPYLLWLIRAGYPVMSLGMLVYMLYQHDHFVE
jgi:hypothetical protein